MAENYADQGYRVIVPALFNRVSRDCVIPYSDSLTGRKLAQQCSAADVLKDIKAAADAIKVGDRVAVVGYY